MPRPQGRLSGLLAALLLGSLILAVPYLSADKDSKDKKGKPPRASKSTKGLPITELSEDEAILHALNRLGFGPRPGEVERVRQVGLPKWIDQQLKPESVNDAALEARLERFPTLTMSAAQLLEEFPQPKQAAKQAGLTMEEYQKQRSNKSLRRELRRQAREGTPEEDSEWLKGNDQSGMLPDGNDSPAQFGGKRGAYAGDPNQPPMRLEDLRTPQRIVAELSMAKITRAVYSERQLQEAMVDFWFNHFNVFAPKGAVRWLVTPYERDVMRPHALGKFKDLLFATAQSPAMLFYLDNWLSADPKSAERMQQELTQRRRRLYGLLGTGDPFVMRRWPGHGKNLEGQPPKKKRERGLNENYARELMELHTLGVDGGYTQQDVIEVAKCFTGWTLRAPRSHPEFYFEERIHDLNPKMVLGKKINAGGMRDGEQVLELLARHPNTAKFISTKLARQFVSDTPPAVLVDRMAKTFLDTDGDIRAVLRTMIASPEFWSRQAYRAKIKKPFELVASTARALGAELELALPLVMWTARIGEPLYQCQPPTGYSAKAEAWVNTGALLNRLNFSLALAGNRMRGTRVDLAALLGHNAAAELQAALERTIEVLLSNQVSPQTRDTLEKQLRDPQVIQARLDDPVKEIDLGVVAGLVLGAPEFQRR